MSKDDYEQIYWISAVSEATLFSDFQDIAQRARCVSGIENLNPSDIAKREWLNVQENWLLVVDNLENIEVINGYLPDELPARHTLITNRNPYCDHIPAEGLRVGEVEVEDAT
jgi:hypothetical protein